MQTVRLALSFVLPAVLPALLFACNMPIDPVGAEGSGGAGGGASSSTSTSGSTSTSSTSSGAVEMGTAEIRFINLVAVMNPALFDALHVKDLTRVQKTLKETQGTEYITVPADGETQLTITDSKTEAVLAVKTDVFLEAGKRYSVAFMPGNKLSVLTDDYSGIAPMNTRVNILNAETAGTAKSWIGYFNGDAYEVKYTADIASGESWKNDLPFAAAPVQLELEWADLDKLLVDWNIAAYVQTDQGSLINVYVWNDNCAMKSVSCAPQIIGHYEDGHTAAVDGSHGWAL